MSGGWHVLVSVRRDSHPSRGIAAASSCVGDQGHPGTWVWIGSGDIEPLCDKFRAEGAKVRHPPTNYQWAYETQIEDPDGNVLRFGSDPKPDQPIGEWLDMHGTAWVKSPAGEESRVDCT